MGESVLIMKKCLLPSSHSALLRVVVALHEDRVTFSKYNRHNFLVWFITLIFLLTIIVIFNY